MAVVCFVASVVGAICGIGGGVIIKPVFDALELFSVDTTSFVSGCIVLCMAGYSILREQLSGCSMINKDVSPVLGVGAATGGLLGKMVFRILIEAAGISGIVGKLQSAILFFITGLTILYTVKKKSIKRLNCRNKAVCFSAGLLLGFLSSFLGIGGGPVNLFVLSYFFSMGIKEAASNSLCIILISQVASLIFSAVTGAVPECSRIIVFGLSSLGILGGVVGRTLNQRISSCCVDRLFMAAMAGIMVICLISFLK